jgi:hypothetical protein
VRSGRAPRGPNHLTFPPQPVRVIVQAMENRREPGILEMSDREKLDPEDRVKLDTWFHVTTLLDDYHLLAFDPMYQRGLKLFASAQDREMRENKLKALLGSRARLIAKWEKELGPKRRDTLVQQD